MTVTIHTDTTTHAPRNLWQAIGRGLRGRCPHCGEGRLFNRFLKVVPNCDVCGEELHHHRADDLPAYLSIVVVGHVIVFLLLELSARTNLSPMTYILTLVPLSLVLSIVLLQPIKGAVVGLQWANRMHGFDRHPAHPDPAAPEKEWP
jgi:uncharacterized protein (DUF983 family)